VIDEIDADRIVLVSEEGDLQLGADAIGARDQHRMLVSSAFELKQPAERTDVRQHARREGRSSQARILRTVSLPASISTPEDL
jgi:hypothetical protein